jgi:hypothetical protein
MTMPFSYVEAPQLIGGWPILPNFSTPGDVALVPRVLRNRATILGVQKETASGFAVRAQSFYVEVDSYSLLVTFSAGVDPLDLDDVVDEINVLSNADPNIGADIARRDGGFLRLESPTVGSGSTLKLSTDSVSSGEPLYTLGLYPETESRGGELASSEQYDPSRQVVYPGQLIMAEGEDLEARTINRAVMQVALNSDFSNSLLRKKQMAKVAEVTVPTPGAGFYIDDVVYTGPTPSPLPEDLENVISILDSNGDEAVKEDEDVRSSGLSMTFSIEAATGEQLVTCTGAFLSTDPKDDIYVLSDDAGMSGLQGHRLKILRWISNNQVAIRNVGPDGVRYPLSIAVTDGKVLSYVASMVRANQLLTGPGGSRVEQLSGSKKAGTVTRIDFNNRIICSGSGLDFTTQAIVGDKIVLAGHSGTTPYNNDGTYRVSKIVNKTTVELMTLDFGPVILNPSGVSLGTFDLRYNGDFYYKPYVELTFPVPTGTYRVLYRQQSNLNEISSDPTAFASVPLKYQQETDAHMQEVLRRIQGPSSSSYLDILYNDNRLSLEDLDYRLENEHDEGGHHTVVRANQIGVGASRFTPAGGTFLEVRLDTDWTYGLNFSQDYHTLVGKPQSRQLTFLPVGAVTPNGEQAGIHFQGPTLTSGVTPVYGRLVFYQESDSLVDPTWTTFTIAAANYSPLSCNLKLLAAGSGNVDIYGSTINLIATSTVTSGTHSFVSDANFKIAKSSGNPIFYADADDFYYYDRALNWHEWWVDSVNVFAVSEDTVYSFGTTVLGPTAASATSSLKIGHNSSGDRLSQLWLRSDDTYTDWSLCLLAPAGANAERYLASRGTGELTIKTVDAGDLVFGTSNTDRMAVRYNGQVIVGDKNFWGNDTAFQVNNTFASWSGLRLARFYSPNITNGHTHFVHIGKEDSSLNTGEIGWYHAGDGSTNNYMSLGYYGYQVLFLKADATIQVGHPNGICRNVDNSILFLSGGSSAGAGANIEIGGPSAGSSIYYDATAHTFRAQNAGNTVLTLNPGSSDTIRIGAIGGFHDGGEKNFSFNCYFNGANWIRINTGYVHQLSTTSGGSNLTFRYGTTGTAGTAVSLSEVAFYHGSLWRSLVTIEAPTLGSFKATNADYYYRYYWPMFVGGDGSTPNTGKRSFGYRWQGLDDPGLWYQPLHAPSGHVLLEVYASLYKWTASTCTWTLNTRAWNSSSNATVLATYTDTRGTGWWTSTALFTGLSVTFTAGNQYWIEVNCGDAAGTDMYMVGGLRCYFYGYDMWNDAMIS